MLKNVVEKKAWQVPSKVLSGLHTANLSWQTRVAKLPKVGKLVPAHVKLVSNHNTR